MFGGGLYCGIVAILNRARGSQLFGLTDSTTIGRIVSMGMTALLLSMFFIPDVERMVEVFAWSFASLMLWCVWAWDKYWSAAIGNPTDLSIPACKPVDWIMAKFPAMPLRLWGTVAMGIRQEFLSPCIVGLCFLGGHMDRFWLAMLPVLFGVPYLIGGIVCKKNPVAFGEYAIGALLGCVFVLTIN